MDLLNNSETKTMSENVKALYEAVHKVLLTHSKLNCKAMCAAQALGYNGFKRWHRYRSKQFFDLALKLSNELTDRFRIKADFRDYELNYSPASLEEHLKTWEKAVLDGIQELGELGKSYYELTGTKCGIVEAAITDMSCDYGKIGRYIKRFNESDWLALDMHIVDDRLHDKYKQKEEGTGLWSNMLSNAMKF